MEHFLEPGCEYAISLKGHNGGSLFRCFLRVTRFPVNEKKAVTVFDLKSLCEFSIFLSDIIRVTRISTVRHKTNINLLSNIMKPSDTVYFIKNEPPPENITVNFYLENNSECRGCIIKPNKSPVKAVYCKVDEKDRLFEIDTPIAWSYIRRE